MAKLSLKTRITMLLPMAITVLMALGLYLVYVVMQSHIKTSISTQQYQLVSMLADEIDYNINNTQKILIALSGKITPKMMAEPAKALDLLHTQEEHLLTFDNGLFLFTPQGRILAELPLGTSRTGKDFAYRDYMKETLRSGKPFISAPYISSQSHHHPAIMFTAPIYGQAGVLIGIMGGSIDLTRTPFVEKLANLKIGANGYLYLISTDRTLISHPDPKRIMKNDTPPGINRLLDRAVAGFDGTDETVTSRGLHALTSFRHLKTNNWIIAANYPLSEAYAPILKIKFVFLVTLLLCSISIFWSLRRYLLRLTDPIVKLMQRVETISVNDGAPLPAPQDYEEIAVIDRSINALVTRLNQQKEKFRIFFEESGDAIFIVSTQGIIVESNKEASRHYGFTHAELVGMSVAELDTPEERAEIPARIAAIRQLGSYGFESTHMRKNAPPIAVEINANMIHFEGDDAILAVVRDISSRKIADVQLHRQNEYLTALHETTLGLIRRHDVAGLLQTIVTRAGNLMGTEHCYVYLKNHDGAEMDMVFQSGVFDSFVHHPLLPGQGIAGQVWVTENAIQVADYKNWEHRLPDPDRDIVSTMAGVPLKSGDEIVGVLGLASIIPGASFSDEQMGFLNQFGELASLALDNARLNENLQRELSERKKAETNLRKLSVAVEQSPLSVLITDIRGAIEYVNPHFTELTGYCPEDIIGQNPSILKSGETGVDEYRQLWQTILSGGEWRGEFLNRKKDGDLYWEQALIAPIRDEQGQITHFIALKEDITERKRLENQLRHSQKMEAVGQLAGGIAHDFNNILTAVIGYASILTLKLPEDSPLKNNLQQITATAERGASLTQGLLAFSRKQESNPRAIDLNEIISRVQQLLRRLISEEYHLTIELSDGQLPVMADSVQIEQILMNLATNARDALEPNGSITVKTELVYLDNDFIFARGFGKQGHFAMLSFTDSGHGMDEETAKHVFEPFFTTKELGKGTGLGLSIAYGIIKKHNGYITCHSTVGIGTTFQIFLPLVEGSLPITEEQHTDHGINTAPDNEQRVVLLAEDDDLTRELTVEVLEQFGYTAIVACDGAEALEKFRANSDRICLLILDAIMPRMKGIDVYIEARKIVPDIRAVFCSGYTEDIVFANGPNDGHQGFLAKPFMPKELLMKIREVLDHVS